MQIMLKLPKKFALSLNLDTRYHQKINRVIIQQHQKTLILPPEPILDILLRREEIFLICPHASAFLPQVLNAAC